MKKTDFGFRFEKIEPSDERPAYNIYKGNALIAEVRGSHSTSQTIIPMRELDDEEEDQLNEFVSKL